MTKTKYFFLILFMQITLLANELTIKHREYNGVGYSKGYTSLSTFLIRDKDVGLYPFLDARGHFFINNKFAANIGGGFRVPINAVKGALGANFYYDYRDDGALKINQLGPGLEYLSSLLDVRLNGYIPLDISTRISPNTRFDSFQGHNMIVKNTVRAALPAIEGEVGKRYAIDNFELYGALGSYYLFSRHKDRTSFGRAAGGKARLFLEFYNHVFTEASANYDHIFKWTVQGLIGFRLLPKPKNVSRYISQPVIRNEIIPVQRRTQKAPLIDPATGDPFFFLFVNNQSGSDGTFEDPFPMLTQAELASSPRDIIYVFPGDGTTTGYSDGIVLKPFQTLAGSSQPLTLAGVTAPPLTSTMPDITNTAGNGVTLNNYCTVSGLSITGATANGITDGGVASNFTIKDCTISGSADFEIDASGSLGTILNLSGQKVILRNRLIGGLGDNAIAVLTAPGLIAEGSVTVIQDNFIDGLGVMSNGIVSGIFGNSLTEITGNTITGMLSGDILLDRENSDTDPAVIKITNNICQSSSFFGFGLLGFIPITPLIGQNTLHITNNVFENHTGSHISVLTDTRSVCFCNHNTMSTAATTNAVFSLSATAGQFCAEFIGNKNVGTYSFLNSTGDPLKFQVQSPNASLAGLMSINTGSFVSTPPGSTTFVLPNTACP